MDVIADWALVELDMINMVARLSGGTSEIAYKMYRSLNTRGTKSDALMALVESRLRSEDIETVYKPMKKLTKSCEKQRDSIAHDVWGYIKGRDDMALLVSPADIIEGTRGAPDPSKIMVWKERDFDALFSSFTDLSNGYRVMKKLARGSDRDRDHIAQYILSLPTLQQFLGKHQAQPVRKTPRASS